MRSSYGENLKLTIFGTSHGPSIGMTLDGIPAGLPVDFDMLQQFLNRRAPGQNAWSTARKEADVPHFSSGLTDGITNGEPIEAVIYNENVRKSDYDELKYIPRPGHADFAAWMKYGLDFDMSGGGPFSGRLTAPLCIAGGLCKQWLEAKGIRIGGRIMSIHDVYDNYFPDPMDPELDSINLDFPVYTASVGAQMREKIMDMQSKGDSVGGIIEVFVTGIPAGLGGPMFNSIEGHIAQIVYSIPAVKSLGFGAGFDSAFLRGSENNDQYMLVYDKIKTSTNNCGGILGGITNGMYLSFRVAIKPTPSIAKPQKSVNLKTMEEVTIEIKGRHDPCIVPRAVPVVEAAAAIAIYDLILGNNK